MKTIPALSLLVPVFVMVTGLSADAEMMSDNYRITTTVISAGGGVADSANYHMELTVGQPTPLMNPPNPLMSESFDLYPGFWYTTLTPVDTDGDGIFDSHDNCTLLINENQLDTDSDGIGNLCDCDCNQDNFCGGPDFTIFVGCFNSPTNGVARCEAADMNGDGFVGGPDFTRFVGGFNGAPGPAAP